MSSQDEAFDVHHRDKVAKRKRGRACDACRQKKVRCDGVPGQKCTNCATGGCECTYIGAAKKRYPDVAYMEELETQLENVKKLLNKLHPGVDFSSELNDNSLWRVEPADKMMLPWARPTLSPSATPPLSLSTVSPLAEQPTSLTNSQENIDLDSSDDETSARHLFRKRVDNLRPGRPRFLGKSSRFMFLQKALDYKHQYTAQTNPTEEPSWNPRPRPQFWNTQPWLIPLMIPDPPHPAECFPPPDLMDDLMDLYFARFNLFMPLLHRPTFEQNVKNGLHLTDEGFGSTLLLVCAVGARFSEDSRVLLDEEVLMHQNDQQTFHSAGWRWFRRVQTARKATTLCPSTLFDLQIASLAAIYLYGSSTSQPAWPLVGIGLRLALELGAHRKKTYQSTPNVEEEQLKRAFWVLLAIDRSLSSGLGRPCCIQDEDFDLDLPIECDDEYWLNPDPSLAFKQPPGKPSVVCFFNCLLRLKQIHAFALRTIYSINRARIARGYVGPQWEQDTVSELDSTLNRFIDSIPDHLRWDPSREDLLHLTQSAVLYSGYYALQINVHRPFIPWPRKPSPLSFPSLAICTNAARSCIHVLDIQFERTGHRPTYQSQAALFTAGIVLLLNIWGGKLSGSSPNPTREMAEVHKAMKMLRAQEPRWFSAGRYWDVLYDLANIGDLPLPEITTANHKRSHDEISSASSDKTDPAIHPNTTTVPNEDGPRLVAGSRRVHTYQLQHSVDTSPATTSTTPEANGDFVLPVHSADLGRLPLHSAFDCMTLPEFGGGGGWYTSPTQVTAEPVTTSSSNALDSPFVQALGTVDTSTSSGLQQAVSAGQAQFPPILPDMSSTAVPDSTIEDMMAAVTVDFNSSSSSELPENDTLAMWSSAPANFEWGDWGSFISSIGLDEPFAGI